MSEKKSKWMKVKGAGMFELPVYETVRQTFERLAKSQAEGWPGSISIHSYMNPVRKKRQ
jgi:hypothetical protein